VQLEKLCISSVLLYKYITMHDAMKVKLCGHIYALFIFVLLKAYFHFHLRYFVYKQIWYRLKDKLGEQGSSVGIVTGYGLDGPGSNSGGSEIFRTCQDRPWVLPNLLYDGYRDFPGGKERPDCEADPSPTSSAFGHKRVELYLYPPYGP
jgi:hypothetical protein